MAKELLRIVVTQENRRAPITRIFENGVEIFYTKFNFSATVDELPNIRGERAVFDYDDTDDTEDKICTKKN